MREPRPATLWARALQSLGDRRAWTQAVLRVAMVALFPTLWSLQWGFPFATITLSVIAIPLVSMSFAEMVLEKRPKSSFTAWLVALLTLAWVLILISILQGAYLGGSLQATGLESGYSALEGFLSELRLRPHLLVELTVATFWAAGPMALASTVRAWGPWSEKSKILVIGVVLHSTTISAVHLSPIGPRRSGEDWVLFVCGFTLLTLVATAALQFLYDLADLGSEYLLPHSSLRSASGQS